MFISRGYPIHSNVNWKNRLHTSLIRGIYLVPKSCGDRIYNIWECHPRFSSFLKVHSVHFDINPWPHGTTWIPVCVMRYEWYDMCCWMGLCESFVGTKSIAIQDSFLASDLWMKMTHHGVWWNEILHMWESGNLTHFSVGVLCIE